MTAAAGVGLSPSHTSPDGVAEAPARVHPGHVMRLRRESGKGRHAAYELGTSENGRCLHVKCSLPGGGSTGGVRRAISGFSSGSRRRLLQKIHQLDTVKAGLPLFVTLTYPAVFPTSGRVVKRDLDTFLKRVKRAYHSETSPVWGFWKLEPQQRGAPHLHLLVWGVAPFPHRADPDVYQEQVRGVWRWRSSCPCPLCFVRVAWFEVVGSGDPKHLQAGTRTERVKTWNGVTAYASKYLGKRFQDVSVIWQEVGRFWGIFGRRYLPVNFAYVKLTARGFFMLRRYARRLLRKAGRRVASGSQYAGNWAFASPDTVRRFCELAKALE